MHDEILVASEFIVAHWQGVLGRARVVQCAAMIANLWVSKLAQHWNDERPRDGHNHRQQYTQVTPVHSDKTNVVSRLCYYLPGLDMQTLIRQLPSSFALVINPTQVYALIEGLTIPIRDGHTLYGSNLALPIVRKEHTVALSTDGYHRSIGDISQWSAINKVLQTDDSIKKNDFWSPADDFAVLEVEASAAMGAARFIMNCHQFALTRFGSLKCKGRKKYRWQQCVSLDEIRKSVELAKSAKRDEAKSLCVPIDKKQNQAAVSSSASGGLVPLLSINFGGFERFVNKQYILNATCQLPRSRFIVDLRSAAQPYDKHGYAGFTTSYKQQTRHQFATFNPHIPPPNTLAQQQQHPPLITYQHGYLASPLQNYIAIDQAHAYQSLLL